MAALPCSLGAECSFRGEISPSNPKLFTSAPLGKESGLLESMTGEFTMTDNVPDPEVNRDPLWIFFFVFDDHILGAMIMYQK